MINVLVTCVGGGVGQSVVDALAPYPEDYYIIGGDVSDCAYASNQCNEYVILPRIDSKGYVNFLLDRFTGVVDIVVPGHDAELRLFSEQINEFNNRGIAVVVSPRDLVSDSRNKKRWYEVFNTKFPIVPTYSPEGFLIATQDSESCLFPAIAKPAGGSASGSVSILLDINDFKTSNFDESFVIQPYLFPSKEDPNFELVKRSVSEKRLVQFSEVSVQLVFDNSSNLLGRFVSVNNLRNGVPVDVQVYSGPFDGLYLEAITEILKSRNVRGPVNIQGRLTDSGVIYFEMNLRFTGITGTRAALGFNEVRTVIDSYADIKSELLGDFFNQNRIGKRQYACRAIVRRESLSKAKTIMIVGGGSSLARATVRRVTQNDIDEVCWIILSRDAESTASLYSDLSNSSLNRFEFDTSCYESFCRYLPSCDAVWNFAFPLAPEAETGTFSALKLTKDLVDSLICYPVPTVINVSSQSVYESGLEELITENYECFSKGWYSEGKLFQEYLFSSINRHSRSTNIINLRLGRVLINDSQGFEALPNKLVKALLGEYKAKIVIDGLNGMSFLTPDFFTKVVWYLTSSKFDDTSNFPDTLNVASFNINLGDFVCCLADLLEVRVMPSNIIINEICSNSLLLDCTTITNLGIEPEGHVGALKEYIKNVRI